jgi:DNA uptake protein ComE-like DNA-binding protein
MSFRRIVRQVLPVLVAVFSMIQAEGGTKVWGADKPAEKPAKSAAKVDLNLASEEELQELPGIGPANAKKIVLGRPFKNVGELSKTGISEATITKITPLVTAKAPAPQAKTEKSAKSANKVDLNAASEEELQDLPGIGPAIAKKIVSGRPYMNVGELSKAGIPSGTIAKIRPLVTAKTPAPPEKVEKPAGQTDDSKTAKTPPNKGMVWANSDSKIYHKEGSRWYGNTKEGKWMTEQDAIKEGYRAAKNKK